MAILEGDINAPRSIDVEIASLLHAHDDRLRSFIAAEVDSGRNVDVLFVVLRTLIKALDVDDAGAREMGFEDAFSALQRADELMVLMREFGAE